MFQSILNTLKKLMMCLLHFSGEMLPHCYVHIYLIQSAPASFQHELSAFVLKASYQIQIRTCMRSHKTFIVFLLGLKR